mmetsp:Transcript_64605/g.140635  ORF Transcript_64605/g.140635 Transcript_64605/m.140635 type:complete len:212 (+) Transcript_64605:1450-2085(+)
MPEGGVRASASLGIPSGRAAATATSTIGAGAFGAGGPAATYAAGAGSGSGTAEAVSGSPTAVAGAATTAGASLVSKSRSASAGLPTACAAVSAGTAELLLITSSWSMESPDGTGDSTVALSPSVFGIWKGQYGWEAPVTAPPSPLARTWLMAAAMANAGEATSESRPPGCRAEWVTSSRKMTEPLLGFGRRSPSTVEAAANRRDAARNMKV